MTEEWQDIPGYPGYKASDLGRIASCKKRAGRPGIWKTTTNIQRILAPGTTAGGYSFVCLSKDGSRYVVKVHSLIMLAFIGECPAGMEVCHYDDDGTNNRLSNLRYDTHTNNLADAKRNEAWMAECDIVSIREQYASGDAVRTIAESFGISIGYVSVICGGECYKEYGGPIGRRPASSLTVDDLAHMIQLRESGLGYRRIGERLNVSESYVCYIFQGKRLPDKFAEARASMPEPVPEL